MWPGYMITGGPPGQQSGHLASEKRPGGRLRTRRRDDLIHHMGLTWQRIAQDSYRWLKSREGFLI